MAESRSVETHGILDGERRSGHGDSPQDMPRKSSRPSSNLLGFGSLTVTRSGSSRFSNNRRRYASGGGGGDKWGPQTREYSAHHHRAKAPKFLKSRLGNL